MIEQVRVGHPTEQEAARLAKLAALGANEIGWELVDLLRAAVVLHRSALTAWLSAGAPETASSLPEVQLSRVAVDAVAEALRARFGGTPLGPPDGPDASGAMWLIAARLTDMPSEA